MSRSSDELFAEHFESNREILRNFKINSNVVISYQGRKENQVLGTVVGYDTFDNDGHVSLLVKIVTYSRLRESDTPPVWSVDPVRTQVELV